MSGSVNLLWWIAIGALFFWLMRRGGCGGMMMGRRRGPHHGDGHAHHGASGRPVDPVCGMEVDPASAVGTRVADGETYFFCSQTCLDAFDKDAMMYAHRHDTSSQAHHHAGC